MPTQMMPVRLTDTHTHTDILKGAQVCASMLIVSLCLWRMLARSPLFAIRSLSSSLLGRSPSLALRAGKPSNQLCFVCLLFLFCFCSPSVCACVCVFASPSSPSLCYLLALSSPYPLFLFISLSLVISLRLFVGSPGSERATKTNETQEKGGPQRILRGERNTKNTGEQ